MFLPRRPSVVTLATAGTLAGLAASLWLLRYDGTFDTYRQPLFLPFLAVDLLMIVFSTTEMARDIRDWRAVVVRVAIPGAVVAGLSAGLASRNPIYDLHVRDVAALSILMAALVIAAGAGAELGERYRPGTWIRTAWCIAASMLALALIPRVLLLLH